MLDEQTFRAISVAYMVLSLILMMWRALKTSGVTQNRPVFNVN